MFVYRMIKQFKQHIVPFVITTRKIFTVVISIVFYNHPTTMMQIIAIVIVFASASYEYLSEIYGEKKGDHHHDAIKVPDTEERVEMSEVDDSIDERKTQKIRKIWFCFRICHIVYFLCDEMNKAIELIDRSW